MPADDVKARLDRTALIADMQRELTNATERWKDVYELYVAEWKVAFDAFTTVLGKVQAAKAARAKADAERLKMCLDLACVFLPMVAGPAAIAVAPILTARGQLFASTMEKGLKADWTRFAAANPVASKVVAEIGKMSASAGQEAAKKVAEDIVGRLAPKAPPKMEKIPDPTAPLTSFKDASSLTRDMFNNSLRMCSEWNTEGGWKAELVPVAHSLFLNHPWIRSAPPAADTVASRGPLARLIEMSLWVRWARTLDANHWKKVWEWYDGTYSRATTRDGRNALARGERRRVIDALDYAPIDLHFRWNFRKEYTYNGNSMRLLDPSSGIAMAERDTINLHTFIHKAKSGHGEHLYGTLMPKVKVDRSVFKELAEM